MLAALGTLGFLKYRTTKAQLVAQSGERFQVENALMRPDKRPVAVRAYLEDVVRRNDRVFLEFSDLDGLYLTLEATPDTVQQILKENLSKSLNEYAVVAEVQSVRKPTIQVAAEATGEGAEVQLQTPDKFQVRGRCVDLLALSLNCRSGSPVFQSVIAL
jgi:hypothetical protein